MLTREATGRLKLGREDAPASQLEETKGETGTNLSAGLTEKAISVPLCCQSTLQLADSVSNEAERKAPGRSASLRPVQGLGPGTALEQASKKKMKKKKKKERCFHPLDLGNKNLNISCGP